MTAVVVDASVAVKWFVPEVLSEEAAGLLDGAVELLAPDLLIAEVGNVLWKKIARDELRLDEGREILRALRRVPLTIVPSGDLVESALEIAAAFRRTVYDGLYVALAVGCNGVLITADDRLVRALALGTLGRYVRGLNSRVAP